MAFWRLHVRYLIGICALAVAGLIVLAVRVSSSNPATSLRTATSAYWRGDYQASLAAAGVVLQSNPRSMAALLLAGQSAAQLQRSELALEYWGRIELDNSPDAVKACVLAGNLELASGHAAAGEKWYRAALRQDPEQLEAHRQLAYLLGVEGRCWEATPHLWAAVRAGDYTLHHLVLLSASDPVIKDDAAVGRFQAAVPGDPVPLIGPARTAIKANDLATARSLLQSVTTQAPHSVEAWARLGEIYAESDIGRLTDWHQHLPANADEHPQIWVVRGLWCEKQNRPAEAARCYWEAIRRDPNHRQANYRLGQILVGLKRQTAAQVFLKRATALKELQLAGDQAYKFPDTRYWKLKAAELCDALGRPWEAWAWTKLVVTPDSHDTELRLLEIRERALASSLTQTLASHNPARQVDLSDLPQFRPSSQERSPVKNTSQAAVRFQDLAKSNGLNFTYFNGTDPQNGGIRMLETTGGGVGVIDFDQDGWPDLFLPQGGSWPPQAGQTEHVDRLFRNVGGHRAEDVSVRARIQDHGYSQGVAAGDFNNDGFPDLYVAHIGTNQLYVNQGDGTFVDVSQAVGLTSARWTTSCLIADLNGDSWPDLYDVNYLAGDAIHSTICRQGEEFRSCSATDYAAEQDEVYLNLGDGRFENVATSSGIVAADGRGMGIVAADFTGRGLLNLFVANDAVPNFYFVNQAAPRGGLLRFSEEAVAAGLAFDRDGLAQACMGVAAGDADQDGLLDLFVTNFHDESNTLYLQQAGGLFTDATRPSGLREPSYPLVGFGAQFLDGELDGLLDLVVTNGHVYDLSHQGRQYQMAPQYFSNLGRGRFEELAASELGSFFTEKGLGRGLARVDWNRDGLDDFVVSRMNSPASLVVNETRGPGHFLAIHLRGTSVDRDAIGTVVRVVTPSRTYTSQLTAGDGYEASNTRRLVFGLGNETQVSRIEVRWLNGQSQVYPQTPLDTEVLIVQGNIQTYPLRAEPQK
ncbi:MAG: UnbV [Planctomycetaceae bacterium]|nr:UnbV [Planctomycetaceae bacterium]